jgi:hypothetical protein
MEAFQRAMFHLCLVLFLAIIAPISVFMTLAGIANDFMHDRRLARPLK